MGKDKKAFTLIELLVVVGIIAIFSGIGLAMYNRTSDRKLLEGEVRKIQSIIAQTHEKTRKNDASLCSSGTDLNVKVTKYTLTFDSVQNKITVSPQCSTGASTPISYSIHPRIKFDNVTNLEFEADTGEILNFNSLITLIFSLKEDPTVKRCIEIKTKTAVTEVKDC